MGKRNNIGTFSLGTGSYTISNSDGVLNATLTLSSGGSATVLGSAPVKCFGTTNTAASLVEAVPFHISAVDDSPIDGVTIEVVSGTVEVVCNQ